MKNIKKDELFSHLGGFLKSKGIELNEGSYTARVKQGCNLLGEAINATQQTVSQAKVKMDRALDDLRQTIHEKTAPRSAPSNKSKQRAAPREKSPKASSPSKVSRKA